MKVAMWAVFIFLLGIFGLVLINIFGNITTTNQQDYNLVRNTVEASMYDAIDKASYRAGFYLCVNNGVGKNSEGQWEIKSTNDYKIFLNHNLNIDNIKQDYATCDFLVGEVKLKADVFVESFLRRFAESVNNSKSYTITVQEVIEYPPKVSVRIDTFDTFNSTGSTSTEYEGYVDEANGNQFRVRNQVDSIFEEREKKDK